MARRRQVRCGPEWHGRQIEGGSSEPPFSMGFLMWQPIETAPTDGTQVLLLYKGLYPDIGYFQSSQTFEHGKLVRETHEWWSSRSTYCFGNDKPQPTHWMPIPPFNAPPPEADAA